MWSQVQNLKKPEFAQKNTMYFSRFQIVFFFAERCRLFFLAMAGKTRIEDDTLPWTVVLGLFYLIEASDCQLGEWTQISAWIFHPMDYGMQDYFPFLSQGQTWSLAAGGSSYRGPPLRSRLNILADWIRSSLMHRSCRLGFNYDFVVRQSKIKYKWRMRRTVLWRCICDFLY
jgi:hypothetical protein